MSSCRKCGADVHATAVVCSACGASLIRKEAPIRAGGTPSDSSPESAEPVATERVDDAYPALRMGRLRRTSQRHRQGRSRGGAAAPAPTRKDTPEVKAKVPVAREVAPKPRAQVPELRLPEPQAPVDQHDEEDMEPATIIARPNFDDVVDDEPARSPATSPARRYVSEELDPPAEERTPEPPAPFEDRRPQPRATRNLPDERRPLTTVYGALDSERSPDQRSVRLGPRDQLPDKSTERSEATWNQAPQPHELEQRRRALKDRFGGPDEELGERPETIKELRRADPARLTGGRRSDINTKRFAGKPEDDFVLSEVAKQYSREYTGRAGWSAGAIVDSVTYALRVASRTAGRTIAIRRLRKDREGRERVRVEQLSELGEVALSLRDLDNALLDDYRNRLLELHHDQEIREDEVDSLNQQIETSRRDNTQAQRNAQTESDELESQTKLTEEQLRPVESSYRTALKAARSAEEDARALARQIDHARGELSGMSGAESGGDEAARLKARVERWSSERDGLLQQVPHLEEKAAALGPEIERLRKDAERSKNAEREHREDGHQKEAEHKREVQRLESEVERIRVAIENISGQRRSLFKECGRQLDIDRPDHDHLEEIYGELDATAGEIRRFDHEIEIAQAKPEPLDFGALTRAAVAFCGVICILSLFVYAIS